MVDRLRAHIKLPTLRVWPEVLGFQHEISGFQVWCWNLWKKSTLQQKKYVSNFLFPLSVIKWKKPSWDSILTSLSLSSHSASHRLTVSTKQTACLWMTAADTATTCLGYTTCMPTIIITAISATMVTVTGDVRPQAMSVLMWFLTLRIQNTPKIQICPPQKKPYSPLLGLVFQVSWSSSLQSWHP